MPTRIREMRLARGLTQGELAKLAKTTSATISRWEKFPSRVSVDVLENLARILDVSPPDLLAEAYQLPSEIIMVRNLEERQRANPFDPATLESITRTTIDNLAMLAVKGDAMLPTLYDGDTCLIDMSDTDIFMPGMYCIQLGRTAQVRRLSVNPVNGLFSIGCDNRIYESYYDVQPNAIKIIGRIVWVAHKV